MLNKNFVFICIITIITVLGCGDTSSDNDYLSLPGDNIPNIVYPDQESDMPSVCSWPDPGTEEWEKVPQEMLIEECGLDPDAMRQVDKIAGTRPYAIARYGKLCWEYYPGDYGPDVPIQAWSSTKTVGGLLTGIAAYESEMLDLPEKFSDMDRLDKWVDVKSWTTATIPLPPYPVFPFPIFRNNEDVEVHEDSLIAHVLGMASLNPDLDEPEFEYDLIGSWQINLLIDVIEGVIAQDPVNLGMDYEGFINDFFFERLGMTNSTIPLTTIGFGWETVLRDMLRVGHLMLNKGCWDEAQMIDEEWIYKMSHPSFEYANTGYGYLTWVESFSNTGFVLTNMDTTGHEKEHGLSLCHPPSVWKEADYPHYPSVSPDCNYEDEYSSYCTQKYDSGVFQSSGMLGNDIVVHKGLGLVFAVQNWEIGAKRKTEDIFWYLIETKALVLDDYGDDYASFCEDYRAGDYAPDLR